MIAYFPYIASLNHNTTAMATSRVYGLDILRALAILFVLIGHGKPLIESVVPIKISSLPVFDGVLMFFVLSGFLIGTIVMNLIARKGGSLKVITGFWMRRWLRTLPVYMFVLILLCFLYSVYPISIGSYFIFSQNLFRVHPGFFP